MGRLLTRTTVIAAASAIALATAVGPANAAPGDDAAVETSSPYNDASIAWTADAPGTSPQSRSAAPQESFSFESKSLPDGAQTLIHIHDANAPHQYVFPVDLGDADRLEVMDDGTVSLNSDRFPQGAFEAPWATDANGNDISTHLSIENGALVQTVEFDESTAFPVTADPRFNWGVVSGHAYLNREETRIAAGAVGGGGLAALPWLALVPPPFSAVAASNIVNIGAWAVTAHAQGKCLALKFGATGSVFPPSIGVTPLHHTGPDCY